MALISFSVTTCRGGLVVPPVAQPRDERQRTETTSETAPFSVIRNSHHEGGFMSSFAVKQFLSSLTVKESSWRFVTSAGGELAIGTPVVHVGFNVTGGALWLKDGAAGPVVRLAFAGVGGSA